MRVSVIVPVYNAARFVERAVDSALAEPETAEVILIEDGSSDDSADVCARLASAHDRVVLLNHPHGANRGAGASRNLGIRTARYEYIAFLDADDFYLPGRFSEARKIFRFDRLAEGVCEASGHVFDSDVDRIRAGGKVGLSTLSVRVSPEKLFEAQMPIGVHGFCSTNGWVVKRSLFDKTGLFDEHLRLHQDTVMFCKFAAKGRIVSGRLNEPVAMVRFHAGNRSSAVRPTKESYRSNLNMLGTLWVWGRHHLNRAQADLVVVQLVDFAARPWTPTHDWPPNTRGRRLRRLLALFLRYPSLVGQPYYRSTVAAHLAGWPLKH